MPAPASTDHDSRRYEGLAWSHELDLSQLLAAVGAAQPGDAGDEARRGRGSRCDGGRGGGGGAGAGCDRGAGGSAAAGPGAGRVPVRHGPGGPVGVGPARCRLGVPAAGRVGAGRGARRGRRDGLADRRPRRPRPRRRRTAAPTRSPRPRRRRWAWSWSCPTPTAMAWTSLGVTLRWRLAATLAALSAGTIDLYRARLIAEATGPLDDDTARAVESAVLPKAGGQTSGQLRVALRRAVIAADPEGAEQRRKDAQRHAKVSLYPDPDADTATLAGTRLPAVHAAAAMARLTAIARAMKSAGMGGGLDYLRAIAFIGLLLGTLPLVPPPAGDPGPHGPTDPDPGPPEPRPRRLRTPARPAPGPAPAARPAPDPGGPAPAPVPAAGPATPARGGRRRPRPRPRGPARRAGPGGDDDERRRPSRPPAGRAGAARPGPVRRPARRSGRRVHRRRLRRRRGRRPVRPRPAGRLAAGTRHRRADPPVPRPATTPATRPPPATHHPPATRHPAAARPRPPGRPPPNPPPRGQPGRPPPTRRRAASPAGRRRACWTWSSPGGP